MQCLSKSTNIVIAATCEICATLERNTKIDKQFIVNNALLLLREHELRNYEKQMTVTEHIDYSNWWRDYVPIDQMFILWRDSVIPHSQMITSSEIIQNNIKKGIWFSKIGAKIREISQPLDLD